MHMAEGLASPSDGSGAGSKTKGHANQSPPPLLPPHRPVAEPWRPSPLAGGKPPAPPASRAIRSEGTEKARQFWSANLPNLLEITI